MDENNHQDWLNTGTWCNKYICLKFMEVCLSILLHMQEQKRYNLMCSLVAHDKMQPYYEDDERSLGDSSTTKALTALGATLNFIDIWLKLFLGNYSAMMHMSILLKICSSKYL